MVSENWPTYVCLSLYVLATALVTVAANIKNNDKNDPQSHITKHFLASKNFGAIILAFTTFASVFSGYTVVGVPNETGKNGFTGIRWMSFIIIIAISMLWLYPRLRRLSMVRSYQSPSDFINDRFKNKTMSITVAMLMCTPQLLYIGINLFSLGAVIDNLTNSELGFYPVVVASTIMILIFEGFGGMRSVAYTDTVEAVVMIAIFVTVPIMITVFTGGFIGQTNNSEDLTLACSNSNPEGSSGCVNFVSNDIADEYYLRSPSSATILNYILFTLSALSFSLNPHVTQRCLTAKTDKHVRFVVVVIFIAAFVTMTPGILTGITHIANKAEMKAEYQDFGAFQAMLAVFRDRGGFSTFVSYIALLAGIAGIMSTADSALIGVSNTMSIDIFKNWVCPEWEAKKIVYIGKVISLCTMCLCLLFAIYLWETGADYGVVITIQQGLLWQAVPAFVFGMYTSMSTNAVLTGTIIGTVCDAILIGVSYTNNPWPLINLTWTTFFAVAVNILTAAIAHHFIFKNNRGDHEQILSLDKIETIMDGIREPITAYYGAFVWASLICVLVCAFHWMGEVDPSLVDEHGEEATNAFMYNGFVRNIIAGLPDWFFATLMWYIVSVIVGIVATMHWTVEMPEKYAQTIASISMSKLGTPKSKSGNNRYDSGMDTPATPTSNQETNSAVVVGVTDENMCNGGDHSPSPLPKV